MAFLRTAERRFLEALARLNYCNPFLPERIECERDVLGDAFHPAPRVWSNSAELTNDRENVKRLAAEVERLAAELHDRLAQGAKPTVAEVALYEDLILYLLYDRYRAKLGTTTDEINASAGTMPKITYWKKFLADYQHFLSPADRQLTDVTQAAHLFACLFQLRRVFQHVFYYIVGESLPAAELRAAVWQSVFTHDMRRYRRVLYDRMGDMTTLITGPSGTGKELVARAVGLSRYIPFDPQSQRFTASFADSFFAVNLSALSPTLIESELFGHRRGTFTGATEDRVGWLEGCGPLGTVFLDEIGELDCAVQVKLLRLLQTRTFQRLGETETRRFAGKVVAATNRDLSAEMAAGRFREDFYYRLCSDIITTPSLRQLLDDSPGELEHLVRFVARPIVGDDVELVVREACDWIDEHLGSNYAWPGNVRELEQCVRNVLIRRQYRPPRMPAPTRDATHEQLANEFLDGTLTAEQLLSRYCTLIYAQTGSYEESARRMKLDRRTVKAKLDAELLQKLQSRAEPT